MLVGIERIGRTAEDILRQYHHSVITHDSFDSAVDLLLREANDDSMQPAERIEGEIFHPAVGMPGEIVDAAGCSCPEWQAVQDCGGVCPCPPTPHGAIRPYGHRIEMRRSTPGYLLHYSRIRYLQSVVVEHRLLPIGALEAYAERLRLLHKQFSIG
jgi:hypothetical protein